VAVNMLMKEVMPEPSEENGRLSPKTFGTSGISQIV
jgi:hypothetical protein